MSCAPWEPPSAHRAPNPAQATMLPPLAGRGDARYGSIATCALRDASVRSPAPETRRQAPPPDPPQREHNAPRPNRRQHHRQPPTTEAQLAPAPHVGSTTARPRTTCVVSRSAASPLPAKRSDATQVVRGRRRGTNAGGAGPEMWHQRRCSGAGDVALTQVVRDRSRGTSGCGQGSEKWLVKLPRKRRQ